MSRREERTKADRALAGYAALVYLFLYVPIVTVVVLSFNAGMHATDLRGFSLRWYGEAWSDPFVTEALRNSLEIATTTAVLATTFGTMAALALNRMRGGLRAVLDTLVYAAIMVPGIVIGIATLVFVVLAFDWLNGWIAYLWPAGSTPPALSLGKPTVVAAHTLFTMAIVTVLVRARAAGMDRSLIEASGDLGATPWGTFRQVTFPQLFPAILAGFLLAFTFSFDDFIIALFVAGPDNTLPLYVFSSIRRGVTPKINAIASVMLAVTLTFLFVAQILLRRTARRPTRAPGVGSRGPEGALQEAA
ncbi:MAG: ABC transporter permease [Actinomycetota bacterium]|nr:MAG: ABC transporter permease [Actinomycetota bacterium]